MKRHEKMNKQWKELKKKQTSERKITRVSFSFFLSPGFRDIGITCMWFLMENMFLEIICFFFLFFAIVWTTCCKFQNNWEQMFFQKKLTQTCCQGVSGAMCCGKIWDCLRVASVVKTKSVLMGHCLNRLNRRKQNHLSSIYVFFCTCISFYFLLFLYGFFLVKTCFYMILNVFFDFWTSQTILKLTYCNLHHHLVLLMQTIIMAWGIRRYTIV